MQKRVLIFHGTDCNPQSFWYPWLGKQLIKRGLEIAVPSYPDINHKSISEFLPKVLKENKFDSDTILIGHSAGSPLILAILNSIDKPIKQAILVAGYARMKGKENVPDPVLMDSYDWEKISRNVGDIVFINSDNDPWGCNDVEGRYMLDRIGKGKLIIAKGEGHMGSDSFNQPYREFPLLLKLID